MSESGPRVSRVVLAALAVFLIVIPAVQGGVNSWTAGKTLPPSSAPAIMATAADPYVVYAVFQPDLYKSRDGGRTWTRIASFVQIYSLLVDPSPTDTSQDTVYVGAVEGPNGEFGGVLKSTDGGATFARKPLFPASIWFVTAIAKGSDGQIFAGAFDQLFRSTDGGDTWNDSVSMSAVVASLVVSPRDPAVVYAGMSSDFYYFGFGAFAQSSDEGSTWTTRPLGQLDRVEAIAAIDTDPTVFVGLSADRPQSERGVRRSIDGGQTFFHADAGLPANTNVHSLVVDPRHTSTIYAGTDSGIYRSRDSGDSWWSIGQLVSTETITSLGISQDGTRLHAGSVWGSFDLDFVSGPADVAGDSAGGARVLRWNSNHSAVQTVDGSNNWTATPFSATSETWTAVAIATGPDGVPRVLWQNGDARSAVETYGPLGSSVVVLPQSAAGIPTDLSVGPDGKAYLLFTTAEGVMSLATIDGSLVTLGHASPGWSAIALDMAPDGRPWVLWRSADGRAAVAVHSPEGVLQTTVKWGATPDYAVEDLAVGPDGFARVLARSASGSMQVWKVGEDGSRIAVGGTYEREGMVPRRIATGGDGLVRVLWGGDGGAGEIWFLDSVGNHVDVSIPALPPTIAGDWRGTFESVDFVDCDGPVSASANFTVDGSTVDGVLNAEEQGCGAIGAAFHGTLEGNTLQGSVIGGTGHYQFTVGSSASGTLTGTTLELGIQAQGRGLLPIPGGTMHLHR